MVKCGKGGICDMLYDFDNYLSELLPLQLNFSDWEVFLWIPSKCEILSTATHFSSTLNTAWNEMKWQTADISLFLSDLKVLFCLL